MSDKLTHEESVELMLLFICSQLGILNTMNDKLSEAYKDEITNQMEMISRSICMKDQHGITH